MPLEIEIREPNKNSRRDQFTRPQVVIGRNRAADVVVRNDTVSSKHAVIKVYSDGCVIEDLNSANGTFVNGTRITQPVQIPNGTRIQLGQGGPTIVLLNGSFDTASHSDSLQPEAPTSSKRGEHKWWLIGVSVAALACLMLFCGVGGGAILLASFAVNDKSIGLIEGNHEQLSQAVGKVVVGFTTTNGQVLPVGGGTAFTISDDGYLITNQHVVEPFVNFHKLVASSTLTPRQLQELGVAKANVWVVLDRTVYDAAVVHVSDQYDMSILKVDVDEVPFFRLASSDPEQANSRDAFLLGFPGAADTPLSDKEQFGQFVRNAIPHFKVLDCFPDDQFVHTLTKGVVSRVKVEDQSSIVWLQHDATGNPGNSGGPLCNSQGIVVGIHTLGSQAGVYFALSTQQLKSEIDKVVKNANWAN